MNTKQITSGTRSNAPSHQDAAGVEAHAGDDWLLGPSVFGDLDDSSVAVAPPTPVAPLAQVPLLRLAVMGLQPSERDLLEGVIKVSQRRTPRLHLLSEVHARQADVVIIDARDAAAMAWTHHHPWLARRPVIWVDGSEAAPGHTVLRRPVQWAMLPMLLARAIEHGPEPSSGMSTGPHKPFLFTQSVT